LTSPVASERSPHVDGVARRTRVRRRKERGDGLALAAARLRRGALRQLVFAAALAALFSAAGLWFHTAGGAAVTIPTAAMYVGGALVVALVAGMIREIARNTVTSVASLGKNRGYTVVGAAPELSSRVLRQLPPDQRSPLGCVTYEPSSTFATAFRDLQGNLVNEGVVAFIGPLQGEGATTSALCAAASATQQGHSVIVVDCDLRRRSLTRGFGLDPELGVLEACERPEFWRDYIEHEHETGLHFMPAAKPASPWRTLVGQAGLPALLGHLRQAYDLVVLDCPPALGSAEGPMVARLAQRSVVVAVWDETPISTVRHAMRTLRAKAGATSVFVNRVPPGYRFGRVRPD
jgi:Mrp family chromosome partitioning ATPase